jgi:hypothetical protein
MSELKAADAPIPFVGLAEERGHLSMVSCLPPGRMDCNAVDEQGIHLKGFVLVEGKDDAKRVRIFRLQGTTEKGADMDDSTATSVRDFLVHLQATPSPEHYVLHLKLTRVQQGVTIQDEARLGRTCCGYYVTATADGKPLPIGRAPLLSELMVQAHETYAQFERLARCCVRPGFEFVPASRYSPSVVTEVVDRDEARPSSDTITHFREMLTELDSTQFSRREAAASDLIKGGRSTLWFLDHAGDQRLSAEQRQRLRSVRTALVAYSQPDLPFEFSQQTLRELTETPPNEWLMQLRNSPMPRISDWARNRLPDAPSESSAAAAPVASDAMSESSLDRCIPLDQPTPGEIPK